MSESGFFLLLFSLLFIDIMNHKRNTKRHPKRHPNCYEYNKKCQLLGIKINKMKIMKYDDYVEIKSTIQLHKKERR